MAILNLDQRFPIVDPKTGQPTDYFMRMLRGVTGPVGDAATDIATLFSRNLTAGAGLTGGGDLTADRSFAVGAGTGIAVNADDVAIDTTAEAERIRDVMGAALVAGSNVTITPNDGADTITIAASGGGGGGAWQMLDQSGAPTAAAASWAWSSNVPNVSFVNLNVYSELLIIARSITTSVSASRYLHASTDNGATYYTTTGNYYELLSNGVENNNFVLATDGGAATTAGRGLSAYIPTSGLNGVPKAAITHQNVVRVLTASTAPISALRVSPSAGNITGGSIYLLGR